MSIRIGYIQHLFHEAYNIPQDKIEAIMDINCKKKVDELEQYILLHKDKCVERDSSHNQIFRYLQEIKKTNNYLKVINGLEKIKEYIDTTKILTKPEQEDLRKIDSYINKDLRVSGFSVSSIHRLLSGEKGKRNVESQKIDILLKYVFIPEVEKNDKYWRQYFIATKKFLTDKREEVSKTVFWNGYAALISIEECKENRIKYMKSVFEILENIDSVLEKGPSHEEEIWTTFEPYVHRACSNCQYITESVIRNIKNEVMPSLIKERKLYAYIVKENEKENVLMNSQFQCVGLYHISHAFLEYIKRDQEKNVEFERVALKIFAYAASKFQIILHPESIIHAPCGLIGKHIFVGPGCIIGKGCYIEENVVIAGCRDKSEEDDFENNSVTIIGERTTIKKDAMLVSGIKVGDRCVICEGAILVSGTVDDHQYAKSVDVKGDLWLDIEYKNYGGHSYGEDVI